MTRRRSGGKKKPAMRRPRGSTPLEDIKACMLRDIVNAAKIAKVKMGIGGGVAVAAQGFRRDTVDVDAFFHYVDRQKVLHALRSVGKDYQIEPLDDSHWIAVPSGAAPDERIDLLFATGDPEESAIEMTEMKVYRGVRAPMFSVVWIVVTKYLADRRDPKDWLDIYALWQRGGFDINQITKTLKQMGLTSDATEFPVFIKRLSEVKP